MNVNKLLKKLKLSIVTKYILKEFSTTFLIAFLFFFIMFFINHILVNIKPLLEKSIPFNLVATMMITFFPIIIIFTLPFSTMLTTLMVMGRFSSDNEIIAFRALGFNLMKIFGPIFILGIIITITTFLVNDRLVPYAWHQQRVTMRKIMQIKPTLDFKSKTVKKHEGKSIFTNIVDDTKIHGLIIIDKDKDNQKRLISSKTAEILAPKTRKGVLQLKMIDAMVQFENNDRPNEFNFGYSDIISYFISFQDFDDIDPASIPGTAKSTFENYQDVYRYRGVHNIEKYNNFEELIKLLEDTKTLKVNNEQYIKDNITYNSYLDKLRSMDTNITILQNLKKKEVHNVNLNVSLIEFYRKFTNPLACIIFAIFAAPIGIYSKRAGYQIGFILGLFLTAFYWFSLSGSIILGRKFILTPFVSMSLPNLIFLVIGTVFLFKRLKE